MSLTLALRSALSGVSVAQVAMDVTSNNITNANTVGYTRKVAELQTRVNGGQTGGVEVTAISRRINEALALELRGVGTGLAGDSVVSDYMQRTESLFGSLASNSSFTARLTEMTNMLETVTVTPNDPVQHVQVVNMARDIALTMRDAEGRIQALRREVDGQIEQSVKTINTALGKMEDLNEKIMRGQLTGTGTADLEDQRDAVIKTLSEQLDIRTFARENGQMAVYTSAGYKLFDSTPQYLNYTAVATVDGTVRYEDGDFNPIALENNAFPGDLTGTLREGRIKGLVELRDNLLPAMSDQLDNIVRCLHDGLNKVHNQGTAFPPPQSLTGNKHVNATDPFYASGTLRLAVTDASGNYSDYVDLDLNAISKPGPTTVADIVAAANSATSAIGGVAFGTLANMSITADGNLSITATGTRKIAIGNAPSPATPVVEEVSGKGQGFSEYFGLNDFFTSGIAGVNPDEFRGTRTNALGDAFVGTGTVRFAVTDANGAVVSNYDLNLASLGGTINDLITSINGAAGLDMTASLTTDGKLRLSSDNANETIEVTMLYPAATETSTGQNFMQYFGLKDARRPAASLEVRQELIDSPQRLARGKLNDSVITPPLTKPIPAIAPGDDRIARALAETFTDTNSFTAAGSISNINTNLLSYAALFLDNNAYTVDSKNNAYEDSKALHDELTLRNSAVSGVDLEEEMGNLVILENAYNAAAQVIRVVSEMFDKLEQVL